MHTGNMKPPLATDKIIKEFLTSMGTQDNLCTRGLYYYVIQTEEEYNVPMDQCDETKVYWDDGEYESMEVLEQTLRDNGGEDIEDYVRNALNEATEYGIRKRWIEKGMFLTETDAKDHLKYNHYHYSSNARTYIKHAWRAPELELFFRALFTHFDVSSGKQNLKPITTE